MEVQITPNQSLQSLDCGLLVYSQLFGRPNDPRFTATQLDEESTVLLRAQRDDVEIKFNELVSEWRAQKTRASSFSSANASLPAYQFIIGMGEKAVPYILRELSKKDEDWYWALKAISREDPVPPEHRGERKVMRQLWLEWGKAKKYAW
ncbi:MAG: hypothetical protein WBE12_01690 [Candidatus Acidiferrum sp.]